MSTRPDFINLMLETNKELTTGFSGKIEETDENKFLNTDTQYLKKQQPLSIEVCVRPFSEPNTWIEKRLVFS